MRLGIYADLVYRTDGTSLSANRAFVKFVTALPPRIDEVVLLGRLDPVRGLDAYLLPTAGVRFVPLPHYPSVADVRALLGALRGSLRIFASELPQLDAVWLFGPHPLALAFARTARRRRVPVFLGVRQNFPEYVARRSGKLQRAWAVPAAHALERAFRRIARRAPTVVVGEDLGARYAGGGGPVLSTGFSLIGESDLVVLADALERSWDGEVTLLSVGRLDPEKNPLLLPEILALLPDSVRLQVVGDGPLAGAVEERARKLGVADRLELVGYIPNGEGLWGRYRAAHAFLHVSFTEGLPQVLFEAQAAGIPVVATDVGGVRQALAGGSTGLLVAPDRADEAAAAVRRLIESPDLRAQLIEAGLEQARRETLDAQLDRIARFFREHA